MGPQRGEWRVGLGDAVSLGDGSEEGCSSSVFVEQSSVAPGVLCGERSMCMPIVGVLGLCSQPGFGPIAGRSQSDRRGRPVRFCREARGLGELLVDLNATTVELRRAERRLVAGLAVERPSGVRYDHVG